MFKAKDCQHQTMSPCSGSPGAIGVVLLITKICGNRKTHQQNIEEKNMSDEDNVSLIPDLHRS